MTKNQTNKAKEGDETLQIRETCARSVLCRTYRDGEGLRAYLFPTGRRDYVGEKDGPNEESRVKGACGEERGLGHGRRTVDAKERQRWSKPTQGVTDEEHGVIKKQWNGA